MCKNSLFFILLVTMLNSSSIYADTLTVDYIEGIVELKEESEWVELFPDDQIPSTSVIKLEESSFIELTNNDARFSLIQPGLYHMEKIIQESGKINSFGIDTILTQKMSAIMSDNDSNVDGESSMGVRGDAVEMEMEWMDDDILNDFLETGKAKIKEKKYEDAVYIFKEALNWADEEQEVLFFYYIAFAYNELGNYGIASSYIKNVHFEMDVPVYQDYIVLLGKLFICSFAYNEALNVFKNYLTHYENPALYTAQVVYYLSSICHMNLGNTDSAIDSLKKTKKINPSNEIGKLAEETLNSII